LDEIEIFGFGKFAYIMDPDGNKVELWETNDEEYDEILGSAIMKS